MNQGLDTFKAKLVLGSAGKSNVTGDLPNRAFREEVRAGTLGGIVADASATNFLDVLQQIDIDSLFINDEARRIRNRNDLRAQLLSLFGRVNRHVS